MKMLENSSHFLSSQQPCKLKNLGFAFKVIPQKLNLLINFFETFPESSLLSTVLRKTIKIRGHHSRLRDMMGQS